MTLLDIANLSVGFGAVRAVDDVSLTLEAGRTLCLVGESGSGKSTVALAIMRLLPERAAVAARRLALQGEELRDATPARLAALRGKDVSMIFQDPMSSLNPAFTIGFQIAEAITLHEGVGQGEARRRARAMLDRVRIPDAARRLEAYPHELSGGMRQRVMIAMALACNPKLLIADEPTTALDVTIQAQILSLMQELKRELGTALLLITHDLGVVAEMADEVAVMYAGRVVERAPALDLFDRPAHAYTHGLLASVPKRGRGRRRQHLTEIPGVVPRLDRPITGCAFAPRCELAHDQCRRERPPQMDVGPAHQSACWRSRDLLAAPPRSARVGGRV
jgi:oligopeptide/dipeptide ABC transporter ATP-binding protein